MDSENIFRFDEPGVIYEIGGPSVGASPLVKYVLHKPAGFTPDDRLVLRDGVFYKLTPDGHEKMLNGKWDRVD